MATNSIPVSYTPLVCLAADAIDGAEEHGVDVKLSQNTAPRIRVDLVELTGDPDAEPPTPGKQGLWNAAKSAKTAATAGARTAESNAIAFCASAVGVLKNYLGNQWNSAWQAAGFTSGSLRMPDEPLPLLGQLRAYFLANPTHENAQLHITAADCLAKSTALTDARKASNNSNRAAGLAMQARDAGKRVLFKRMSGLLAELTQLLDEDDPRWYAFGFNRPADGEGPGLVQHLVLTPGGPGMIFADWDDARRADRYRVFKQGPTDPAPVEAANSVTESEFTLTGLLSGAQIKIHIVPVNDAGDGKESEVVTATVP